MSRFPKQARLGSILILVLIALPAGAEDFADYRLLDRFVFTVGGAYSDVDTNIRLDSDRLGIGTEINLEDDLGLDEAATSIDLKFEWQVARRHRLFVSYLDLSRSDSATASGEFQIGDLIIPVSATYGIGFDITDYRIGYTYFPWLKDRWALGLVAGLRVLDMSLALALDTSLGADFEFETTNEDAQVVGPLPFLGVEYRRSLSQRWLMMARGGWLSVKVGDYEGGQWLVDMSFENRITKRFGVGAAAGYTTSDVDVTKDSFRGKADLSYLTGRIFGRVFWN